MKDTAGNEYFGESGYAPYTNYIEERTKERKELDRLFSLGIHKNCREVFNRIECDHQWVSCYDNFGNEWFQCKKCGFKDKNIK